MKQKVVVIGYPKSGSTWMTRLVAQLLDAPLTGFLYSDDYSSAENTERVSDYEVYKSHRELKHIWEEEQQTAKLIYVVRDPRDISLSARNYFYNVKVLPDSIGSKLKLLDRVLNSIAFRTFGMKIMAKRMNNALLNGDPAYPWCKVSWKNHYLPYSKNDAVLMIRYESALADPFTECKRIVDFLGIERTDEQIKEAIHLQSFSYVKKKFIEENKSDKASFLRKGQPEQWRSKFSTAENQLYIDDLKEVFKELNYSTKL